MKRNLNLIKLRTEERRIKDDLHIVFKKDEKGEKHIIASNTSKTETLALDIENVTTSSLGP